MMMVKTYDPDSCRECSSCRFCLEFLLLLQNCLLVGIDNFIGGFVRKHLWNIGRQFLSIMYVETVQKVPLIPLGLHIPTKLTPLEKKEGEKKP